MSDLIERLRKGEALPFSTYDEEVLSGLAGEAADEIERLRDMVMERNKERMELQAVVDAARAECKRMLDIMGANAYDMGCRNAARDILRALDGEP